jgi:hypothetical protein
MSIYRVFTAKAAQRETRNRFVGFRCTYEGKGGGCQCGKGGGGNFSLIGLVPGCLSEHTLS